MIVLKSLLKHSIFRKRGGTLNFKFLPDSRLYCESSSPEPSFREMTGRGEKIIQVLPTAFF